MSKYFKIDRNSREIIIDKTKSYNVNVDILDLIIDLQLERDKYKNIINELENKINKAIEYIEKEYDIYDKGIFIVDQYDQPIYVDEIYGALLNILKGSGE